MLAFAGSEAHTLSPAGSCHWYVPGLPYVADEHHLTRLIIASAWNRGQTGLRGMCLGTLPLVHNSGNCHRAVQIAGGRLMIASRTQPPPHLWRAASSDGAISTLFHPCTRLARLCPGRSCRPWPSCGSASDPVAV
jgi:hypothetical protein